MFLAAAIPSDEAARLAALRGLRLLDTPPEPAFDSLARLAAHACGTPIALITLVDENRVWFKARVGLDLPETSRDVSLCAHTILESSLLEIPDAARDERFAETPLVTGGPGIRFYAGVPIRGRGGHALGTLCVIDAVPRRLDDDQHWILRALADQAAAQIELRRSASEAAAALRVLDEERVLLRGVLHAATDYAVIATTTDGTITVFNGGAEKLFGYRADEVIGRRTAELFHDAAELAERADGLGLSTGFEVVAAAARTGGVDRREWTSIRKSGERFPAALTVAAMRNDANEITGFIEVARDLTEERRAERERERLADERTARAAADRSVARLTRLHDVAVALANAMTSPEVFDILVEEARAAIGATSAALTILDDAKARLELVAASGVRPDVLAVLRSILLTDALPITDALREGRPIFVENPPRDERYRAHVAWCVSHGERAIVAAPLLAEGRTIGSFRFGFAEPRVFGEEDRIFMLALGRLGAQAIARARAYEAEAAAHRSAAAANHAKDEFIAVLSHELRTPLTAILGWTQLLRMPPGDPAKGIDATRLSRGLTVIENNARALLRFVEGILEVNRIVAGSLALSYGCIQLGELVHEAVDGMKPLADAAGLTLALTVEPGIAPITADASRLRQVLVNLLDNAIKFTPRGGRIAVHVDQVGDHLRLSVIDTGEGISKEALPRVFERFVQADSSRTRTHGGLGIGLAIVHHLVELHGGTVTAASAGQGQGAELTVLLPITTPPVVA